MSRAPDLYATPDLYAILGVAPDIDGDALRSAYESRMTQVVRGGGLGQANLLSAAFDALPKQRRDSVYSSPRAITPPPPAPVPPAPRWWRRERMTTADRIAAGKLPRSLIAAAVIVPVAAIGIAIGTDSGSPAVAHDIHQSGATYQLGKKD